MVSGIYNNPVCNALWDCIFCEGCIQGIHFISACIGVASGMLYCLNYRNAYECINSPQYKYNTQCVLYCYKITSHLNSDKAQSYSGLHPGCASVTSSAGFLHFRLEELTREGLNTAGDNFGVSLASPTV